MNYEAQLFCGYVQEHREPAQENPSSERRKGGSLLTPEISPPRSPRSQRVASPHQSRRSSKSKSLGLFIRVISHQRFEFAEFLCGLCELGGELSPWLRVRYKLGRSARSYGRRQSRLQLLETFQGFHARLSDSSEQHKSNVTTLDLLVVTHETRNLCGIHGEGNGEAEGL